MNILNVIKSLCLHLSFRHGKIWWKSFDHLCRSHSFFFAPFCHGCIVPSFFSLFVFFHCLDVAWICVSLNVFSNCRNNAVQKHDYIFTLILFRVNMAVHGDTLIEIYNYFVQDDEEHIVAHLFVYCRFDGHRGSNRKIGSKYKRTHTQHTERSYHP